MKSFWWFYWLRSAFIKFCGCAYNSSSTIEVVTRHYSLDTQYFDWMSFQRIKKNKIENKKEGIIGYFKIETCNKRIYLYGNLWSSVEKEEQGREPAGPGVEEYTLRYNVPNLYIDLLSVNSQVWDFRGQFFFMIFRLGN